MAGFDDHLDYMKDFRAHIKKMQDGPTSTRNVTEVANRATRVIRTLTAQACDESVPLESKARFGAQMPMLSASIIALGATYVANRFDELPESDYSSSTRSPRPKVGRWLRIVRMPL